MIAADVSWRSSPTDRTVKHPTERRSIDGPYMYAKANNLARELIHDDEHPMALEKWMFVAYHMDPQTWVGRLPFMGRLRRHHMRHHDRRLMSRELTNSLTVATFVAICDTQLVAALVNRTKDIVADWIGNVATVRLFVSENANGICLDRRP